MFKILFLIFLVGFINNNSNTSIDKNYSENSKIIGEGTVTYVIPYFTPEIGSHIGYILKNPEWEIPPKEERPFTYLEPDSIIKKFNNQLVHIEGQQFKIPSKKIDDHTFIRSYDVIIVNKIYRIK